MTPYQASELSTHIGSLPIDAISRSDPQSLSNSHLWSGKYPEIFESIPTTIPTNKLPGTLLFIPRYPTMLPSIVPQIGCLRPLEGGQYTCQQKWTNGICAG